MIQIIFYKEGGIFPKYKLGKQRRLLYNYLTVQHRHINAKQNFGYFEHSENRILQHLVTIGCGGKSKFGHVSLQTDTRKGAVSKHFFIVFSFFRKSCKW